MIRIHPGGPDIGSADHSHSDGGADGTPDQLFHVGDQAVQVRGLRVQVLTPGEGEQSVGKRGRPLARALSRGDVALCVIQPALCQTIAEQFQAPRYGGQQIIEVMGDAAG